MKAFVRVGVAVVVGVRVWVGVDVKVLVGKQPETDATTALEVTGAELLSSRMEATLVTGFGQATEPHQVTAPARP